MTLLNRLKLRLLERKQTQSKKRELKIKELKKREDVELRQKIERVKGKRQQLTNTIRNWPTKQSYAYRRAREKSQMLGAKIELLEQKRERFTKK